MKPVDSVYNFFLVNTLLNISNQFLDFLFVIDPVFFFFANPSMCNLLLMEIIPIWILFFLSLIPSNDP